MTLSSCSHGTMTERNPETEAAAVRIAQRNTAHDTACSARYTNAAGCACNWSMRVATLAGDIRNLVAAAEKRGAERGRERAAEVCDRARAWYRAEATEYASCSVTQRFCLGEMVAAEEMTAAIRALK